MKKRQLAVVKLDTLLKARQSDIGADEAEAIAADVVNAIEGTSVDKRQTVGVSPSLDNDNVKLTECQLSVVADDTLLKKRQPTDDEAVADVALDNNSASLK